MDDGTAGPDARDRRGDELTARNNAHHGRAEAKTVLNNKRKHGECGPDHQKADQDREH